MSRGRPASDQPPQQGNPFSTLIHLLMQTHEEELSCEEFFALLDQYSDMTQRGEDAAALMPLVKRHLDLCSDCQEEYEALLRVLNASKSS